MLLRFSSGTKIELVTVTNSKAVRVTNSKLVRAA